MRYDIVRRIKTLLEIEPEDTTADKVLGLMVDKNEVWVRDLCGLGEREILSPELMNVVEDLTVCAYNKMGSEGFADETIGPIRIDYEEIPAKCMVIINRHKRLKF